MEQAGQPPQPQSSDKQLSKDLAGLGNFNFGTAWSEVVQSRPSKSDRNEHRPRHRDERDSRRQGARPPREDRPRNHEAAQGGKRFDRDQRRPERGDNQQRGNRPPYQRRDESQQRSFEHHGHRERPFEPVFDIAFYPEDEPFNKLIKVVRNSGRTYELFEIARLIIEKPERFLAVFQPLKKGQPHPGFFVSVPDGIPFESEEDAISHVLANHLDKLFTEEEITIDPPKGSFLVVHRCGLTGELLGPPNYHLYAQTLRNHLAQKLPNVSREHFDRKLESIKDEAVIAQWIDKMTRQTRWTWKGILPEGSDAPSFTSRDALRSFLLANHKAALVQNVNTLRIRAAAFAEFPEDSRIRKSFDAYWEQQKRFPLDTANQLRGRLRRSNFAVYKKGSKGVSYICGYKRKFRTPDQVFSPQLQALIDFIEKHPEIKADALVTEYLSIQIPPEGEALPVEENQKVADLRHHLRWLVTEGYVVEYGDGRLYAAPPLAAGKKQEDALQEEDHGNSEAVNQEVPSKAESDSAPNDAAPEA